MANVTKINGYDIKDKTVRDLMDNRKTLLSISANTYATWGDALSAVLTKYNTLSRSEKEHSVIIIDDLQYFFFEDLRGVYMMINEFAGTIYIGSMNLTDSTSKYVVSSIGSGGIGIFDNYQNTIQHYSIEFALLY